MDLGLTDQVALVTAASRGIGRAVAMRFATEGARVAISSRTEGDLDALAADLAPASVTTHPVDQADADATAELVADVVAQHGRLDIAVINTPGPKITPFLGASEADFATAYDLLFRPAVQLARAAADVMVAQGSGSIVFLTSTWVKQPAPGGVLSATMRSAIGALAKCMATELAPYGIRVNQLMPGATGTDRMAHIVTTKASANGTTVEEEIAKIAADIPVGRWAEASEIADAVVFLASPRSTFTTGAAWQLDGGAVRASY